MDDNVPCLMPSKRCPGFYFIPVTQYSRRVGVDRIVLPPSEEVTHLRIMRADADINPDVIFHLLEQYIHLKHIRFDFNSDSSYLSLVLRIACKYSSCTFSLDMTAGPVEFEDAFQLQGYLMEYFDA